jgi:hypothetical protein
MISRSPPLVFAMMMMISPDHIFVVVSPSLEEEYDAKEKT